MNQPRACWKTRLANRRLYGLQFPFCVRRASEKNCQPVQEMAQPASGEPTASRSKCQLRHWRGARYGPPTPPLVSLARCHHAAPTAQRALTTDPEKPTSDCLQGRAFACNENLQICSPFPFLRDFPSAVRGYGDLRAVKTPGGKRFPLLPTLNLFELQRCVAPFLGHLHKIGK